MSDFREELIEAMARARWERECQVSTHRPGWDQVLPDTRALRVREAQADIDAALAFRQTVECPECGGTGKVKHINPLPGEGAIYTCPGGCIDGRVPGQTRLAIVEPAERLPAFSDVLREAPPVFLLAPDLPETEK